MLKVKPHPDYPPEEGRYLRGNDSSPAGVVIVLNQDEDKIPKEIQSLVRTGVESGAALSGTIQTPNIGLEKVICNFIANPNIRYLILSGPESPGHKTGDAIKCLFKNGVDKKKKIIGTEAQHAILYNLPDNYIERFLKQVSLIDLQFKGIPEMIRKAVWSCFQEEPVEFEGYQVHDIGAYPEETLSGKITDRIMEPWTIPDNKEEQKAVDKMQEMVEKLRNRNKEQLK